VGIDPWPRVIPTPEFRPGIWLHSGTKELHDIVFKLFGKKLGDDSHIVRNNLCANDVTDG
jgi:hypothetical protein